ncbi:MAG TPA: VOC family protein [Gemmatimonadales bacterium]|jgi:uncharacterized glyoxalase superfamily protein PhnB|nr:VOC family protein [Gemmatimonadales bacterium]
MALLLEGESLQASLTVKDLEKSVAWYTQALGFVVTRRIERDGKLRGVAVHAGAVRIILNQDDGMQGWDRIKGQGMSFQISTQQEINAVADHVRASGSPLETEPTDTPWGARIFRVRDPDGFRWTISRATAA